MQRTPAATQGVEQCWTLVGQRRGRVWLARRVRPATGDPASVRFDGPWVLRREEQRYDVVGFFHTHPGMPARPSRRDVRTMRAWCSAFGKPLLCIIAGIDGVKGYRFEEHSSGARLREVACFARGVIVGVERDGE